MKKKEHIIKPEPLPPSPHDTIVMFHFCYQILFPNSNGQGKHCGKPRTSIGDSTHSHRAIGDVRAPWLRVLRTALEGKAFRTSHPPQSSDACWQSFAKPRRHRKSRAAGLTELSEVVFCFNCEHPPSLQTPLDLLSFPYDETAQPYDGLSVTAAIAIAIAIVARGRGFRA